MGTRTVTTDYCDIFPTRVKDLGDYEIIVNKINDKGGVEKKVRHVGKKLSPSGLARVLHFVDKGTVKVIVEVFQRPTPLELEYWQIEQV